MARMTLMRESIGDVTCKMLVLALEDLEEEESDPKEQEMREIFGKYTNLVEFCNSPREYAFLVYYNAEETPAAIRKLKREVGNGKVNEGQDTED